MNDFRKRVSKYMYVNVLLFDLNFALMKNTYILCWLSWLVADWLHRERFAGRLESHLRSFDHSSRRHPMTPTVDSPLTKASTCSGCRAPAYHLLWSLVTSLWADVTSYGAVPPCDTRDSRSGGWSWVFRWVFLVVRVRVVLEVDPVVQLHLVEGPRYWRRWKWVAVERRLCWRCLWNFECVVVMLLLATQESLEDCCLKGKERRKIREETE